MKSSLAGHLKLSKLIMLYDSNDIQLDGPTNKAFSEDIQNDLKLMVGIMVMYRMEII